MKEMMEISYCLYCEKALDFEPIDDGGFCSVICEDLWMETGGH